MMVSIWPHSQVLFFSRYCVFHNDHLGVKNCSLCSLAIVNEICYLASGNQEKIAKHLFVTMSLFTWIKFLCLTQSQSCQSLFRRVARFTVSGVKPYNCCFVTKSIFSMTYKAFPVSRQYFSKICMTLRIDPLWCELISTITSIPVKLPEFANEVIRM